MTESFKYYMPDVFCDDKRIDGTVKRYPLSEIRARLTKLGEIIDKNRIQAACREYLYMYNEEYALNRAYYDLKYRFTRYKIANFGKYFVVPFDHLFDTRAFTTKYTISSDGSVSIGSSSSSGVTSIPMTTTIDYTWSATTDYPW